MPSSSLPIPEWRKRDLTYLAALLADLMQIRQPEQVARQVYDMLVRYASTASKHFDLDAFREEYHAVRHERRYNHRPTTWTSDEHEYCAACDKYKALFPELYSLSRYV